jgi:hypothetical protein
VGRVPENPPGRDKGADGEGAPGRGATGAEGTLDGATDEGDLVVPAGDDPGTNRCCGATPGGGVDEVAAACPGSGSVRTMLGGAGAEPAGFGALVTASDSPLLPARGGTDGGGGAVTPWSGNAGLVAPSRSIG